MQKSNTNLTYPNVRMNQHLHGFFHVFLEFWMKSVKRSVDRNGHVWRIDVIEQYSQAYIKFVQKDINTKLI